MLRGVDLARGVHGAGAAATERLEPTARRNCCRRKIERYVNRLGFRGIPGGQP